MTKILCKIQMLNHHFRVIYFYWQLSVHLFMDTFPGVTFSTRMETEQYTHMKTSYGVKVNMGEYGCCT